MEDGSDGYFGIQLRKKQFPMHMPSHQTEQFHQFQKQKWLMDNCTDKNLHNDFELREVNFQISMPKHQFQEIQVNENLHENQINDRMKNDELIAEKDNLLN